MKILLVSGFLGAGKTTFIKALAKQTGKEFAVLENEYGAVGIDGDILKNEISDKKVNIWEMAEGCICCSMKGDFASTVLTIANTVDPEYLVIEPTGVAMLGQIVKNLQQIEYERITLLAPVTIVDGHSFFRYEKEYRELYQNQIASARTVIISKMENAAAGEREALERELKRINPSGVIVTEHYSSFDRRQWLSLLEQGFDGEVRCAETEPAQELPDTFSMKEAAVRAPELLFYLLEALIRGEFGNIFRAKGQVRAGNQKFMFDVADGLYSITGGEPEAEDKVVFIGTGIARQKIRRYFFEKTEKIAAPGKKTAGRPFGVRPGNFRKEERH